MYIRISVVNVLLLLIKIRRRRRAAVWPTGVVRRRGPRRPVSRAPSADDCDRTGPTMIASYPHRRAGVGPPFAFAEINNHRVRTARLRAWVCICVCVVRMCVCACVVYMCVSVCDSVIPSCVQRFAYMLFRGSRADYRTAVDRLVFRALAQPYYVVTWRACRSQHLDDERPIGVSGQPAPQLQRGRVANTRAA